LIVFDEVERVDDGEHVFAVYDCKAALGADLVSLLAKMVRDLYVDVNHLRDVLTTAMNDASAVADPKPINDAIRRTLAAAVPKGGTHPVPHLDVARNELAEALAHLTLANVHGTVIPASRIRNKEVSGQPSRGRDLLGLEDDPLTAVVGEIKASSEAASPPGVVGDGDSSLASQVRGFLATDDALLAELNWALKHAAQDHHVLLARAILAHIQRDLPVCAAPVLVRPVDKRGADDFGTFRHDPAQFAPARIRFLIVTIEGTLEHLANDVYEAARA
jgi:hypothetical protein